MLKRVKLVNLNFKAFKSWICNNINMIYVCCRVALLLDLRASTSTRVNVSTILGHTALNIGWETKKYKVEVVWLPNLFKALLIQYSFAWSKIIINRNDGNRHGIAMSTRGRLWCNRFTFIVKLFISLDNFSLDRLNPFVLITNTSVFV